MEEPGNLEALAAQHVLKGFDCGNQQLSRWLIKYAWTNQQAGTTKTFVLPTLSQSGCRVVAFYSLVAGAVVRDEAIPAILASTPTNQSVPVILLARLAVAKEYQGKGLGQALLKDALWKSLEVSRLVGVRAVLVHAKDALAATFYQRHAGFEPSPTNPLHLMLPIQDIAAAFE